MSDSCATAPNSSALPAVACSDDGGSADVPSALAETAMSRVAPHSPVACARPSHRHQRSPVHRGSSAASDDALVDGSAAGVCRAVPVWHGVCY